MMRSAAVLVGGALALSGCVDTLEPGESGTFRYVANVRGAAPLSVIPPVSDREGNAYVAFGSLDLFAEAQVYIGRRGGGWVGEGCDITEGSDFGLHGFVGTAERRAWYWVGDALAQASSASGRCERLLEFDPSSGARLAFRAVIPFVRDTPSRTTLVAWIQSPTDLRPFEVLIDLDNGVYTEITTLNPRSARNVIVLGTGANPSTQEGVVLSRFTENDTARVRAYFYDNQGTRLEATNIGGLSELPEYGIRGYLMANDEGLYAGVDVEGQLVVLDKSGGQRTAVNGMTAVGVHRWEGNLYLVGEDGNRPKIAAIDDDGQVGQIRTWDSARFALSELGNFVDVVDDRSLPSRDLEWEGPRAGGGTFPLVQPHSNDFYVDGTTSWLIAGPSFQSGGQDFTAMAYAPVGVSYEE